MARRLEKATGTAARSAGRARDIEPGQAIADDEIALALLGVVC